MNYIRNQQGTKGQKEEEEKEDTYDKLDDMIQIQSVHIRSVANRRDQKLLWI